MPKSILVVGAASAIAREVCRLYALDKASFFLVGRDLEKLKQVKKDLVVHGAEKAECYALDLLDFNKHDAMLKEANSFLGGLDMVFIAHGVYGNQEKSQADYLLAEKEIKTNFLSVISLLTPIASQFENARKGTIAVLSSPAGDRGRKKNYIYGCAKGGLSIFLEGLWQRLASKNVAVVTIKPGFIETPMTEEHEKSSLFVKPEEVAESIYRAINRKKKVVYVPFFWYWIMLLVKHLPGFVFRRLNV